VSRRKQALTLGFVGVPLLLLVIVGIATTAYLAVSLVISGLREGQPANLALGTMLGALWLLMMVKTARDRGGRPNRG
jgi:hypothetical protein